MADITSHLLFNDPDNFKTQIKMDGIALLKTVGLCLISILKPFQRQKMGKNGLRICVWRLNKVQG
jgi:hypothetical protein